MIIIHLGVASSPFIGTFKKTYSDNASQIGSENPKQIESQPLVSSSQPLARGFSNLNPDISPQREFKLNLESPDLASSMRSKAVSLPFTKTIEEDYQRFKLNQLKRLNQPTYNPADKYNIFVKPLEYSKERIIPDSKALQSISTVRSQPGLNFKMISTGKFEKSWNMP